MSPKKFACESMKPKCRRILAKLRSQRSYSVRSLWFLSTVRHTLLRSARTITRFPWRLWSSEERACARSVAHDFLSNQPGVRVILCGVGETQMNDEASACRKNSRGRLDIWGNLGAEEQGDSSRGVVRDGVLVSDVNVWGGDRGA